MSSKSPTSRLSHRPKLAQIRIDEVLEYSGEVKAGLQKRKEAARESVVKLLKNVRGTRKEEKVVEQEEVYSSEDDHILGPRPVSRRARTPAKISVPAFDISDEVLNRLTAESSTVKRRPTSKFFARQRRRAGIDSPSTTSFQTPPPRRFLDAEDIIYMFAGAPYFDVEQVSGRSKPKVAYGWGSKIVENQDMTDYKPFKHESFLASTTRQDVIISNTHQHIGECPDMLSANGRDPGTIGLRHFLELPLQAASTPRDLSKKQQLLMTEPDSLGLREFDIENIVDRLTELSKVYDMLRTGQGEAAEWDQCMIEEIGEDLFSTLLDADLGTTQAGTGDVSLRTQISAIQNVLHTADLWYDFSIEEYRARYGQLLWEPEEVCHESEDHDRLDQRMVLMLQLALSAELAVRLEIAHRLAASGFRHAGIFTPTDLEVILAQQSEKLNWDILLFQRFLASFEASTKSQGAPSPLRRLSFIESADYALAHSSNDAEPDLTLQLRQERRQWKGLRAFAESICWPDLTNTKPPAPLPKFDSFLTPPVHDVVDSDISEYDTPMSSPPLPSPLISDATPALILLRSQKMLISTAAMDELHLDDTGRSLSWEAKSWFSASLMPGLSISKQLMHTLLQTSPAASSLIAVQTDICHGFVLHQRSYWSKTSIAGRVLAPTSNAEECMGWIALPFVPQHCHAGWIYVLAHEAPFALLGPRMSQVASSSDPLHGYDASILQAQDFTTPLDGHIMLSNEVRFLGMSLIAAQTIEHQNEVLKLNQVNVTFISQSVGTALTIPLIYDVHFISSYPCYPYTTTGASRGAYDAAIDSSSTTPSSTRRDKELPSPPAHPLHVRYTYTIIPAAALLSSELPEVKDTDSLFLLDSTEDRVLAYHIEDQEVVVLDCRGSSDLEVLARAWCAKMGENALIGREGRTCLACCIREAIGLGIGIVIRIS